MTSNPKILIIDDDTEFASELRNCLVSNGYHVLPTCDNVKDGLNAIHEHYPDGVVLDIQLKGELGLEVLNHLNPESGSKPDSLLIVVSAYINKTIIALLNKKKCLYFDKSYNYKHELILNYFNDLIETKEQQKFLKENNIAVASAIKVRLTDEQIKSLIHKKLSALGFNSKVIAYDYLTGAIYHILAPNKSQRKSLTIIFKEVAQVEYSSAFNGIKRLISTTFNQNTDLFCELYHGTSKTNMGHKREKLVPSVKNFIYHIAHEIKEQYFD